MKLNSRVSRDNARHFESKERLGEACALRHEVHRLEFSKGNVNPVTGHEDPEAIALLFLQTRRQMGWTVNATPRPLYPRERDSVPILQEAGWAPGSV
jgi:hypothetical protein